MRRGTIKHMVLLATILAVAMRATALGLAADMEALLATTTLSTILVAPQVCARQRSYRALGVVCPPRQLPCI